MSEEFTTLLLIKERDSAKLSVVSCGNTDLVVSHSVDCLGEKGGAVPVKGFYGGLSQDIEFRADPFKKSPVGNGYLLALWSNLKNLR